MPTNETKLFIFIFFYILYGIFFDNIIDKKASRDLYIRFKYKKIFTYFTYWE